MDGTHRVEEAAVDVGNAPDFVLGGLDVREEARAARGVGFAPELAGHELEVEGEGVEGVPDFVGESGGEVLDGVRALVLARIGLAGVGARDVAEDDNDGILVREGAEFEDAVFGVGELDFAGGLARPAVALGGGVQQTVPLPGGQQVVDGLAAAVCEGGRRQAVGCGV